MFVVSTEEAWREEGFFKELLELPGEHRSLPVIFLLGVHAGDKGVGSALWRLKSVPEGDMCPSGLHYQMRTRPTRKPRAGYRIEHPAGGMQTPAAQPLLPLTVIVASH